MRLRPSRVVGNAHHKVRTRRAHVLSTHPLFTVTHHLTTSCYKNYPAPVCDVTQG